jgi:hypothetical protein
VRIVRRGFGPILAASLLVASCGSAPAPTGGPPGSASTDGSAAPSDAPSSAVSEPTPSQAPPIPTSEDLIAAALAAGSITYEQSLLDRALALYNSPGLPAQFDSPVVNLHAAQDLLVEIDQKEATLSADLLAKLAPFRARPSDPISIYNVPPAKAGVNARTVADTIPTWTSLPAAGGAARVWVKASPDSAAQLARHAADVQRVWTALHDFFTYPMPDAAGNPAASINPDGAIDFYFVDGSDLDPRRLDCVTNPNGKYCLFGTANDGYATPAPAFQGNESSGYLVVGEDASGDNLVDTLAHELTHAGQYAYDWQETSWLKESTATWVAYRVMKKLGLAPEYEYGYLSTFFDGLDQTLTRPGPGNTNSYASWLYFQFAAMEAGPEVVQAIWEAAAADGVQGVKAVDSVFSFDTHFPAFALRNWNKDPVQPKYKTPDDTFPGGLVPKDRNKVTTLPGGKEDSLNVSLPPMSSAYFEYVFPASTRDITFDNTLANTAGAHVWAMRNVNETWKQPEDWSGQAKPTFCRDVPDQDVGQLILVVSNSSLTDTLKVTDAPKVTAGTKGCAGWVGTMTGTYTWTQGERHGSATTTFTGVWEQVPADDQVQPCQPGQADSCIAYYPHGTIHWTRDEHQPICSSTQAGDAPAGGRNDPAGAIFLETFYLQPDGNGHYSYWGISSWLTPKVDCSTTYADYDAPPSYFDIPEGTSGNGDGGAGGNECFHSTWQIDVTATTIKGGCFEFRTDSSSSRFDWNLTRIGPAPGS